MVTLAALLSGASNIVQEAVVTSMVVKVSAYTRLEVDQGIRLKLKGVFSWPRPGIEVVDSYGFAIQNLGSAEVVPIESTCIYYLELLAK
jgi:hypothetical protein